MVLDCLEVKSQTVNSRCTLNPAIEAKMSLDFIGGFNSSSYIPIPIFWIDKAQPENTGKVIIGPGGMHGVQCTENIYQKRLAREHKC